MATSAALVVLVATDRVAAERSPTHAPLERIGAPRAGAAVPAAFADRDAEVAGGSVPSQRLLVLAGGAPAGVLSQER